MNSSMALIESAPLQLDASLLPALNNAERALFERIVALSKLTETTNWDDEQGLPIGLAEWARAWEFYLHLRTIGTIPVPFVSPCGDGSVHFTWTDPDGRRLNVELNGNEYWWSSRTSGGAFDNSRCEDIYALENRILKHFTTQYSDK